MTPGKRALLSSSFAASACLAVLLAAPCAHAQTRYDVSLQAGASGRVFSNPSSVAGVGGSMGPVVGLEGDVALIPLVRIGAYVDYEYAVTGEPAAPSVISFGGRVKAMLPGYRNSVHWWLFTGFGGAVLQAPGYTRDILNPTETTETIPAATGYFFEIPVGVGMGWRVRRPWEIVAELQGRFGFAMSGSYFTNDGSGNGLTRPSSAPTGVPPTEQTGTDVVAILLTVGIALDE